MELKVFKGVPILETDRLIIRAISINDIEPLTHHMKNKEVRKFFDKFWPSDKERDYEEKIQGKIARDLFN